MVPYSWAMVAKRWSLGGQFQEFGRGIIGPSGVVFFVMIAAVMLYLSMVLIGRRHWNRSGSWFILGSHFIVRAAALGATAIGLVYVLYSHPTIFRHSTRFDATSERLSTLSPNTIEVIDDLRTNYQAAEIKRPVRIEAFVSTKVPETYLQTRLNLLEHAPRVEGPSRRHDGSANQRRGAHGRRGRPCQAALRHRRPGTCTNIVHGAYVPDSDLHFRGRDLRPGEGGACRSSTGARPSNTSWCGRSAPSRSRSGSGSAWWRAMPRFSAASACRASRRAWQIIDDLKRQYEVIPVSPSQPIPLRKPAAKPGDKEEGFDVLVAVQPSAMGPPECDNLIAAIRAGQPTVLFEDPFPLRHQRARHLPAPPPARIRRWPCSRGSRTCKRAVSSRSGKLLGISFSGSENGEDFQPIPGDDEGMTGGSDEIVFQNYNPYSQAVRLSARVRLRRRRLRRQGIRPVQREGSHHFRPAAPRSSLRRGTSTSGTRAS